MIFCLIAALLAIAIAVWRLGKRMDDLLLHVAIMALYVSGKSLDDLLADFDDEDE